MTEKTSPDNTDQRASVDEDGQLLIGGRAVNLMADDLSCLYDLSEGDQLELLGSTFQYAALEVISIPPEMQGTVIQGADIDRKVDQWLRRVERAAVLAQTAVACYDRADVERRRYARAAEEQRRREQDRR